MRQFLVDKIITKNQSSRSFFVSSRKSKVSREMFMSTSEKEREREISMKLRATFFVRSFFSFINTRRAVYNNGGRAFALRDNAFLLIASFLYLRFPSKVDAVVVSTPGIGNRVSYSSLHFFDNETMRRTEDRRSRYLREQFNFFEEFII